MQTESINRLLVFSQYDELQRSQSVNPFLLHMGMECSRFQVGALGQGGLLNHTSSHFNRICPSTFIDRGLQKIEPVANALTVTNQPINAPLRHEHMWMSNMNYTNDTGCEKRSIEWEDRLQMLVEFKNKHGHCAVPQSYPLLGSWVKWQREKYALYEAGKVSNFTPEKIEQLNALGFIWRLRRKRTKRSFKNESESERQSREVSPQCLISNRKLKRLKESSV